MAAAFEQQAKESAKAFAAFSAYLSMGPKRSFKAVAQKLTKSSRLLKRWSRRFDWPGRVRAHAEYLATAEREATEALVRGKAAEWLKRQQAIREEGWAVSGECVRGAREALKRFYDRGKGATLGDISRMYAEGRGGERAGRGTGEEAMTELEDYIEQGLGAGCTPEQMQNFVQAGVVLQPRQLAASATGCTWCYGGKRRPRHLPAGFFETFRAEGQYFMVAQETGPGLRRGPTRRRHHVFGDGAGPH